MKVEQFTSWEKETKVVERIGEQENTWKKVEGYGLKFTYSNWNSNSNNTIYNDFEMIFKVLHEVIFWNSIYLLKLEKSRIQCFKWCANRSWNEEDMDDWRELCKEESKECQLRMNRKNGLERLFLQQLGN